MLFSRFPFLPLPNDTHKVDAGNVSHYTEAIEQALSLSLSVRVVATIDPVTGVRRGYIRNSSYC